MLDRSKNKTLAINEEIIQHDWDILAISEPLLKQTGNEAIVTELLPPGYTFHHVARPCGRLGRSCRSVSEHVQH